MVGARSAGMHGSCGLTIIQLSPEFWQSDIRPPRGPWKQKQIDRGV